MMKLVPTTMPPLAMLIAFVLLAQFLVLPVVGAEPVEPEEYPSVIRLRAGVLHAPPLAVVAVNDDGEVTYSGFEIDFLRKLEGLAQQDNVTLQFDLSASPGQYDSALELVANDCHTIHDERRCDIFDIIVGDFYMNAARSMRIDYSPPFLATAITTIKYNGNDAFSGISTLTQATHAKAPVCVPEGTFIMQIVMEEYPRGKYHVCDTQTGCIQALKDGLCVLYTEDELLLKYAARFVDPNLQVSRERINSQWVSWVFRDDLPPMVSRLLKKWMYGAIEQGILDELYFEYFEKELCPIGTAGENCEKPCDADHGTANVNGICICESTKWTGEDCSEEVAEELNMIPPSLKSIAYVLLGINIAVIAVCGMWLFWYRKSAWVQVSQPFFLVLVLFGCLVSSTTIVALAQEDEGDGPVPGCQAIPWLYSCGWCITFGTLFAKILRVYRIFTTSAHQQVRASANSSMTTTSRRNQITFQGTLAVIGAVMLIDMAILTVWTIVDPLQWERTIIRADQYGAPLESQGRCTSDHWVAFGGAIACLHLLLLCLACFLCYKARAIPTTFSESKYVSIAMISNLQIFIVAVPVLVVVGSDTVASFFISSVVVWMNDLAVVSILFGNLMYSSWHSDRSTGIKADPSVRSKIGMAVSKYANVGATKPEDRRPPSPSSTPSLTPAASYPLDESDGGGPKRNRDGVTAHQDHDDNRVPTGYAMSLSTDYDDGQEQGLIYCSEEDKDRERGETETDSLAVVPDKDKMSPVQPEFVPSMIRTKQKPVKQNPRSVPPKRPLRVESESVAESITPVEAPLVSEELPEVPVKLKSESAVESVGAQSTSPASPEPPRKPLRMLSEKTATQTSLAANEAPPKQPSRIKSNSGLPPTDSNVATGQRPPQKPFRHDTDSEFSLTEASLISHQESSPEPYRLNLSSTLSSLASSCMAKNSEGDSSWLESTEGPPMQPFRLESIAEPSFFDNSTDDADLENSKHQSPQRPVRLVSEFDPDL